MTRALLLLVSSLSLWLSRSLSRLAPRLLAPLLLAPLLLAPRLLAPLLLAPLLLAPLLLAPLLGGCLVEPLPEEAEVVRLQLGVELPPVGQRAAAETTGPWDQQGLFHLDRFPKLVRVSVESQDYTLATGTWPTPEKGIGAGESATGEVAVEIAVAAGAGRRLTALGYLAGDGWVQVYREASPLSVDLVAGKTSDLKLDLFPHPAGSVEFSARCEEDSSWRLTEVAAVDGRAFVIWPYQPLVDEDGSGVFRTTFHGLPTGRPYWARFRLQSKDGSQTALMDLRKPTFSVTAAGEKGVAAVTIPCQSL